MLSPSSCSAAAPAGGLGWRSASFRVEIADDDAERARGLMFRDRLEDGTGMLFIHEAEQPQAY